MQIINDIKTWQQIRQEQKIAGRTLGFVPTMGALHNGHMSLIRRATAENEVTLVSIFVNPTQFDNEIDLEKYPQTFNQDQDMLTRAKVDYLLVPSFREIYPDKYQYRVIETDFSQKLCGGNRPGHFEGVLTVVMKLLNIVQAERAYFGEKDFQQLQLIRGMVEAFFIPTEVIACPIVRENDGLAMSSRNLRLNPRQRELAPLFAEALRSKQSLNQVRHQLEGQGFKIDYLEEIRGRRFGAVFLGDVRLIDNIPLKNDLFEEKGAFL